MLIRSVQMFPTDVNDPVEKVMLMQKSGQDVRRKVLELAEGGEV